MIKTFKLRSSPIRHWLGLWILILGSGPGFADDYVHEIKLGLLHHDTSGLWSGFNRESGLDLNLEATLKKSWKLGSGTLRPAFGATLNSDGDTNKVYATARWETGLCGDDCYLALGLGAALHDGERRNTLNDRKALGSNLLFHIPFELGYRFNDKKSLSLYFDHMSNGYLDDPNEGMDTLGIRFGLGF